jgi:DNA polymerase/3'-5' exonuclease PolX
MSDKQKFPRAAAMKVAREICLRLADDCVRLELAGSLRREKQEVGDVEILYIPDFKTEKDGLFDTKQVNRADEVLAHLLETGIIAKRRNVNGSEMWGEKNKLAVHVASGIPIDFFCTSEKNWWVSLVVRTGSKETNLRLTTGAIKLGRTLNAYGCGVAESDGNVIPATSEQHVFQLCGVPYLEPINR